MSASHNYAVMPSLATGQQPLDNYVRLEPRDRYTDVREGIQARVKDPLFFLARQLQAGEFAAFNGGRPARVEALVQSQPLDTISGGGASDAQVDLEQPLDYQVERELPGVGGSVRIPYWDAARFEYN